MSPSEKWSAATAMAATALSMVDPTLTGTQVIERIEGLLGGPLRDTNRTMALMIYNPKALLP